ncbi:MAG: ornithine cyclodeaminase family protein [Acetobacteraceae bacterium]|nr:ornithine cyclodeaminase family protein [Acetobacteraceae bacterium]
MQMIDAARVHALLSYDGLIEALRKAHLGTMPTMSDRHIYEQPHPDGQPDILIVLPAWQAGEGMLTKIVTSFPRNQALHGLPTVNSLYVFLDGSTGVPEAVIDGEAMIFRKTSADSALGASILARKDARTLLMAGAGKLAPYLVRAHCSVRPSIEEVLVWNRTAARAEALAATLAAEGFAARAVADLDQAVSQADIISSATMAEAPIIRGRHLKPGTHVDLVGSFTPAMREADDDVLRRSSIFVDHRQTTRRSGEFLGPFERGVISPADVRADLFDLCQGKAAGRTSATQITMMKNGGGSHIDYFVAKYTVDMHRSRP